MSVMDSADQQDANPGGTGQANSPDNSESEIVSLREQIDDLAGRVSSLQSEKDKSVARTNQRLSDFEKQQEQFAKMQAYLEKYGSPEEAARQAAFDALLQGGTPQAVQQTGSQRNDLAGQEASADKGDNNLVPLLGVSESDPQFVRLRGEGLTPNEAAIKIAEARRKQETQDPNVASGMSGGGVGGAADAASQTVLDGQYREALSKIQPGNWKAITDLKAEFRKKGLNVW